MSAEIAPKIAPEISEELMRVLADHQMPYVAAVTVRDKEVILKGTRSESQLARVTVIQHGVGVELAECTLRSFRNADLEMTVGRSYLVAGFGMTEEIELAERIPIATDQAAASVAREVRRLQEMRAAHSAPSSTTGRDTQPPEVENEAAPVGALSIQLEGDWGEVWIDGARVTTETPLNAFDLAPGRHAVRVQHPDKKKPFFEETVTIESESMLILVIDARTGKVARSSISDY